jgi:hypothetical protein
MKTWHEIHEVTSETLTLKLPEHFSGKTVEVIISPVETPYSTDHYQVTQTATTGINAIFGQWPGDETDAEIDELLEQLS